MNFRFVISKFDLLLVVRNGNYDDEKSDDNFNDDTNSNNLD